MTNPFGIVRAVHAIVLRPEQRRQFLLGDAMIVDGFHQVALL